MGYFLKNFIANIVLRTLHVPLTCKQVLSATNGWHNGIDILVFLTEFANSNTLFSEIFYNNSPLSFKYVI